MAVSDEEKLYQMRQTGLVSDRQLRNFNQGQSLSTDSFQSGTQNFKKLKQQSIGLWSDGKKGSFPIRGGGDKTTMPIDQLGGPIEVLHPVGPGRPGGPMQTGSNALIDSIYEKSRESQIAALEGQYTQQKNEYNKQKGEAPEKFNPLRNEAYVNNTMAERSRKESMANMGLSGAGGMSQTIQQRNTGNLMNALGDVSRQQQDYTDNINFALGQLTTQYDSNRNSINLQIDSEKNKAYLDQGNWEKNFGLQKDQYDLTRRDSNFNKASELLRRHLITKKEFEEMTGIDIN